MVNPEFCWVGQSCFAHWTPSQPSQPSQRKLFETNPKSLQFTCCFKLKHGETAKLFCRDESMSLVSLVWFKARTSWSRTSTTSCLPCTTIQQLLPWLGVKFWQGMNISQVALEELKTGDIKKKGFLTNRNWMELVYFNHFNQQQCLLKRSKWTLNHTNMQELVLHPQKKTVLNQRKWDLNAF